jgi:hypothetical protein
MNMKETPEAQAPYFAETTQNARWPWLMMS